MPVYFITELHDPDREPRSIKIGFSSLVERRVKQLQTGNANELKIMGKIEAQTEAEDRAIEKSLHEKHSDNHIRGEWFSLYPEDVMKALHSHSPYSFLSVGETSFEIEGYDRDGIPEFASAWEWGDIEPDEFCPACVAKESSMVPAFTDTLQLATSSEAIAIKKTIVIGLLKNIATHLLYYFVMKLITSESCIVQFAD